MNNKNALITTLYHFRFASQRQLTQSLGHSNHSQVSRILKALTAQGLVTKFDGRNIIEADVYCLTGNGCKYIKSHPEIFDITAIPRSLTRNIEASRTLLSHAMRVLDIYLALRRQYADKLAYISKISLSLDEDFELQPLPDAQLRIRRTGYMLEFFDDSQWKSLIKRRLGTLSDYWDFNEVRYVLVCESITQYRIIQKLLQYPYDDMADEVKVMLLEDVLTDCRL